MARSWRKIRYFFAFSFLFLLPLNFACARSDHGNAPEEQFKTRTLDLFSNLADSRAADTELSLTLAQSHRGLSSQLIDPDFAGWREIKPVKVALRRWAIVEGKIQRDSLSLFVKGYWLCDKLIVHLSWADQQPDLSFAGKSFPDACALEYPFLAKKKPPCAGMGEAGNPVKIWRWSADTGESEAVKDHICRAQVGVGQLESLICEGASTITPFKSAKSGFACGSCFNQGRWAVTVLIETAAGSCALRRPGGLPVAFAVWDGQNGDSGGQKFVSSWIRLQIPETGQD